MNDKLISALLSLLGSLVGSLVVVKVFFWSRTEELAMRFLEDVKEALREKKANLDICRAYADPLEGAALSLKYRLEEVLTAAKRAHFLLSGAPPTAYNRYKFASTVYRLCAVLGWIRGYRRERSYLDPMQQSTEGGFERAVDAFQSALADGVHIEIRRAEELIKVWLRGPAPELAKEALQRIAVSIDTEIDKVLGRGAVVRETIYDATTNDQRELCEVCRNIIQAELNVEIPAGVFESRLGEATAILGITEAWVFRDWQQAVGDFMLQELHGASRRFDVMGFREFSVRYKEVISNRNSIDGELLCHIEAVFKNLDLSKAGIFDARREQLKQILRSVEMLIKEIGATKRRFAPPSTTDRA